MFSTKNVKTEGQLLNNIEKKWGKRCCTTCTTCIQNNDCRIKMEF